MLRMMRVMDGPREQWDEDGRTWSTEVPSPESTSYVSDQGHVGLLAATILFIATNAGIIGLQLAVPIYSGGLGILAGDHCKAASDARRANLLRKLGMRDRVELVRYAIRRGLIEP